MAGNFKPVWTSHPHMPQNSLPQQFDPNLFLPKYNSIYLGTLDQRHNTNYMTGSLTPGSTSHPQMPQNSLLQQVDPNSLSIYHGSSRGLLGHMNNTVEI